jgi:hypothetical protein
MFLRESVSTRGNKTYRYIQMVRSVRVKGKRNPTHRVVASLSNVPEILVDNLRVALSAARDGQRVKVAAPPQAAAGRLTFCANLTYLGIAVLLRRWRARGLDTLLARLLPQLDADVAPALVIAALVVQRCVDPDSKLAAVRWLPTTALPELLGLNPASFNNSRLHRVLADLEAVDGRLQNRLARLAHRSQPALSLFLDVTDTWFVGTGPALAQTAKTKEGMIRRKVGIVLCCSEQGYPLRWHVIPGKRPDGEAMTAMVAELSGLGWTASAPLVCDRAMGCEEYLTGLARSGLHFLTSVPVSEFDKWTSALPTAGMPSWEVSTSDPPVLAQLARKAALAGGMQEVDRRLCVLDCGLRWPWGDGSEQERCAELMVPGPAGEPGAAAEMQLALALCQAIAEGKAGNYAQAARLFGLNRWRARRLVLIGGLHAAVRECVLAGEAEAVAHRVLYRLARLPEDQQVAAFDEALARAADPGGRARRRAAVGGRPKTTRAEDLPMPHVAVRVVVFFNPEAFVTERANSARLLAAVERKVAALNERLASPSSKRGQDSILGEVSAMLRKEDLLSIYTPRVEPCLRGNRHCLRVDMDFNRQAWERRRRFDGFSVLVGHSDLVGTAADIVRLYRAKDAVERDFKTMKSAIDLRPVRHQTDLKLRAHVALCMLALFLQRDLEASLAAADLPLTASWALTEMKTCHLNEAVLPNIEVSIYGVTTPTEPQRRILAALDALDLVDDRAVVEDITPR